MADLRDLSEEEIAMLVALQQGRSPRAQDPLCKALDARGLLRFEAGSWTLTPAGAAYRPQGAPKA